MILNPRPYKYGDIRIYPSRTPREQIMDALDTIDTMLPEYHETTKLMRNVANHVYPAPRELRVYRIWADTQQRYVETRYNPDRGYFEWRYPGHDMSWARNKPDHVGWVKCERVDVNALHLKENPYA